MTTLEQKLIYQNDNPYAILVLEHDGDVYDARIFKTATTLKKLIESYKNKQILLHPNPVLVRKEFYEKYRKAKTNVERVSLFKEFNILSDDNMLNINTIFVDVDSTFEEAFTALEKLIEFLSNSKVKVKDALTIYRTKSDHLRFCFHIKPLNPRKKNKNKKSNLENVKEFVTIINDYFKSLGLNADDSFKRINHPVWVNKKQEVIQKATHEIDFYYLFNKIKKLQNELQLYPAPKRVIRKTTFFNDRTFKKAVHTLYLNAVASQTSQSLYLKFLQPLAGWVKSLGIPQDEYLEIAEHYGVDIKMAIKAFRYAKPLEFKTYKTYNIENYAEQTIKYLQENGNRANRQELLKKVFHSLDWLEETVMSYLVQKGLIAYEFQKGDKGRPRKVYYLLKTQEINTTNTDLAGASVHIENSSVELCEWNALKNQAEFSFEYFTLIIHPDRGCIMVEDGLTPPHFNKPSFSEGLVKVDGRLDFVVFRLNDLQNLRLLGIIADRKLSEFEKTESRKTRQSEFDFQSEFIKDFTKALFGAYVSRSPDPRGPHTGQYPPNTTQQVRGPYIPDTDTRGPNNIPIPNITIPKLKKIPKYGNLPF